MKKSDVQKDIFLLLLQITGISHIVIYIGLIVKIVI